MATREHTPVDRMTTGVTVLQLDTRFPRVPGDVASPESYAGPVEIIRIPRATVGRVVTDRPDAIDIAPFEQAIAAARGEVIVTSCGFLAPWQSHLAGLTDRPFISSALGALDRLQRDHVPGEVMILTFDAATLGPPHLGARAAYLAGVVGLPRDMPLRAAIAGDAPDLDVARARADVLALAARHRTDQHRHILLECTNLPPYAPALRAATGLPVTDILTEIERLRPGSIRPRHLVATSFPDNAAGTLS